MVKMDSLSIRKTNGVKINAMTDDDNSFSLIVPSAIVINSNYECYPEDELLKKIKWTEEYFQKFAIKTIYLGQNQTHKIDFPTEYYLKNNNSINNTSDNLLMKHLGDKYISLRDKEINFVNEKGIPYTYDQGH